MVRRADVVIKLIPLAVAACHLASAQQPTTTTLTIDLENVVQYQEDGYDPSKFARNPNVTPSAGIGSGGAIANFVVVTLIGDVVAVNGQPVKRALCWENKSAYYNANPTPVPGQAIADVTRTAMREHIFEILQPDGTPIGSIMSLGFSGGSPLPASLQLKRPIGR